MSISYTLDKRCTEILNIVMYTTGYLKVQDLADDLEVSIMTFLKLTNGWSITISILLYKSAAKELFFIKSRFRLFKRH